MLTKQRQTKFKTVIGIDYQRAGLATLKEEGPAQYGWNVITRPASLACNFANEFELEQADFVGSKSAFYIINLRQIENALRNTRKILSSDGVFFFARSFATEGPKKQGCYRHKWSIERLSGLLIEQGLTTKCEEVHIVLSNDSHYFHVIGGPKDKLYLSGAKVEKSFC